ncbi:MAG: sulfatase-like hydrolase/transferase [Gammaproteobacteria bacterium]
MNCLYRQPFYPAPPPLYAQHKRFGLKRNGLSFRNAFIAASACSPSRAALLTGTYSSQTGSFIPWCLPATAAFPAPRRDILSSRSSRLSRTSRACSRRPATRSCGRVSGT